jgi:hypothetical protein
MENQNETTVSSADVTKCFEAMQEQVPKDKVEAMGLTDDYTKASLFIEQLTETVKRYFIEYTQVPPKPVVMEAARMLIDTMLVTVALPRAIEKYFMIFGLNAVSTAYDYFFDQAQPQPEPEDPKAGY